MTLVAWKPILLNLPWTLQQKIALDLAYEQVEALREHGKLAASVCENESFWCAWLQTRWPLFVKKTSFRETARYFVKELPEQSCYQRALQNDPRVTTLVLFSSQIGDAGAQALAQNQTITTLWLPQNNISQKLQQQLRSDPRITI